MATPADVADLLYRWRAGSLSMADGASVSSIPNEGGSGTMVMGQSTASLQPVYRSAGAQLIGGRPVFVFDGTDDKIVNTSGSYFAAAATTHLAVLLPTTTGPALGQPLWTDQEMYWSGNGNHGIYAVTETAALGGPTRGVPQVWSGQFAAASAFWKNGTVVATGTTALQANGSAALLGNHLSQAASFPGSIAEYVIWNHKLTTAEMAQMHSYVQDTYGITVADYVPPYTDAEREMGRNSSAMRAMTNL